MSQDASKNSYKKIFKVFYLKLADHILPQIRIVLRKKGIRIDNVPKLESPQKKKKNPKIKEKKKPNNNNSGFKKIRKSVKHMFDYKYLLPIVSHGLLTVRDLILATQHTPNDDDDDEYPKKTQDATL